MTVALPEHLLVDLADLLVDTLQDVEYMAARWPRRPTAAWLVPETVQPAEQEVIIPLCSALVRLHLSAVLSVGPSVQEGRRGPAVLQRRAGSREGSGAQILRGAAEGTGFVQRGEGEAQGRPDCSLQ